MVIHMLYNPYNKGNLKQIEFHVKGYRSIANHTVNIRHVFRFDYNAVKTFYNRHYFQICPKGATIVVSVFFFKLYKALSKQSEILIDFT
jgi:hypothetical protein